MSREIRHTGGSKEFHYTKEDIERIESQDTDSTKEFKEALGKWKGSLKYRVSKFFRYISPRSYYNYKPFLKNFFILVILGIVMAIIYSNLEKLNDIVLIFIKLGSTLMLVALFFSLKYIFRIYKNIKYFIQIQRSFIKWSLAIILLVLLLFAYQNKDELFNPVIKVYEETDFGRFSPFSFSLRETSEQVATIASDVTEKASEVVSIKPVSIDEVEKAVLKYTNEERKSNGLDQLTWDSQLGEIARAHSEDMVKNDFFDHINLKGEDPTDRAKKAGFTRTKQLGGGWYSDGIAENIGKMPTGNVVGAGYVSNNADSIAKAHVESWMGSSGHRANILNEQYTHLGVGVAYDGLYYVATQNFW